AHVTGEESPPPGDHGSPASSTRTTSPKNCEETTSPSGTTTNCFLVNVPSSKGLCCLLGCQGDFNETCMLTDSQQSTHFSQNSETDMREVLTINVRGLHTDTALAVHGRSLLTSTNQGSTLWDSSLDDWSLSPHRWLCAESTLTVLA